MDRYIGLNAHTSSCTVATIGPSGKRLHSQVVETNAKVLRHQDTADHNRKRRTRDLSPSRRNSW